MLELDLAGQVAVITGGSEGVGRATAAKLAEEGCRVAICARRPDILEAAAAEMRSQSPSSEILAVAADVSKSAELDGFFAAVADTFDGIDILVNNAGRAAGGHFEEATDEVWQEDFDLKFWGAVRCARLALPHMKARGGGSVINITHPGGKAPSGNSMPTSVTRAAGIAFTKALSHDVARFGIRVNTVCLTNIRTAQIVKLWKEADTTQNYDEWCAGLGVDIPLGRLGNPEEVADLIAFLVSDRAGFITGASVNIDGGVAHTV